MHHESLWIKASVKYTLSKKQEKCKSLGLFMIILTNVTRPLFFRTEFRSLHKRYMIFYSQKQMQMYVRINVTFHKST